MRLVVVGVKKQVAAARAAAEAAAAAPGGSADAVTKASDEAARELLRQQLDLMQLTHGAWRLQQYPLLVNALPVHLKEMDPFQRGGNQGCSSSFSWSTRKGEICQ